MKIFRDLHTSTFLLPLCLDISNCDNAKFRRSFIFTKLLKMTFFHDMITRSIQCSLCPTVIFLHLPPEIMVFCKPWNHWFSSLFFPSNYCMVAALYSFQWSHLQRNAPLKMMWTSHGKVILYHTAMYRGIRRLHALG